MAWALPCAALAVCAYAAAAHLLGVTVCPLRRLSGVPCPTCGATRAAFALLRGDVPGAFALNPLAVSLLFVATPFMVACVARRGRRNAGRMLQRLSHSPAFWAVAVLAVAANWVYLLLATGGRG